MNEKIKIIADLFRDILDDENLVIDENFSMETCSDWDSVVTVQIVLAVERQFNIKFSTDEVAKLKSITDILNKIK